MPRHAIVIVSSETFAPQHGPTGSLKRSAKDVLLATAIVVAGRTLLSTAIGRRLFDRAYLRYKNLFEGRTLRHLESVIAEDDWIIDAGANAGFFTAAFCDWISGSGRVIAIEPAPANVSRLRATLSRGQRIARVDIIEAAVTDTDGEARLRLDAINPADHQLTDEGLLVPTVTLDRLMADRDWPPLGLIKIDVQGAEPMVIDGAIETLKRLKPAIFLEIADDYLRPYGSSGSALLRQVIELGYTSYMVSRSGISEPLSLSDADRLIGSNSYIDLLFLPSG